MNVKRIILSLSCSFLVLQAVYGQGAQIDLDEEIKRIPARVSNIYTCGQWEHEGKEGFYRIIYFEFYYGCSLLYIQWMHGEDYGLNVKSLHTLSIEEFNADDHIELTFSKPECEETYDGISFHITADSGHDENKHHIELKVLHEFGKYSLEEEVKK